MMVMIKEMYVGCGKSWCRNKSCNVNGNNNNIYAILSIIIKSCNFIPPGYVKGIIFIYEYLKNNIVILLN